MTRICETPECGRPHLSKGMCSPCYHKAHKAAKAKLPCTFNSCGDPVFQTGLCHSHYHRKYVHGDPAAGGTRLNSRLPWLTETVKRCLSEDVQECVTHPFGPDSSGYCEVTYQGKRLRMHVVSIILSGRIAPARGEVTRHLCGRHGCVNPLHLEVGTQLENSADTVRHDRSTRGERHPRAILTELDVRSIRASTETQGVLADRFGISRAQISYIRSRRAWKHVE